MRATAILTLWLSLILTMALSAQQASFRFQYLKAEDGLSQNSVNDIYQDKQGYLWLATQDGLNRYDGYEFKVYRPELGNQWTISDNFVTFIYPNSDGNLFLGTRHGLNYFSQSEGRFYKLQANLNDHLLNQPEGIFEWRDTLFAIFTYRTFVIPKKSPDTNLTLMPSSNALWPDTIYAACNCGNQLALALSDRIQIIDSSSHTHEFMASKGGVMTKRPYMHCHEGRVITGYDEVLYEIDTRSMTMRILTLPEAAITQEIKDVKGQIWVGTTKGLFILEDFKVVDHIRHEAGTEGGLSYPLIHSIQEDRDGNVWIGTANSGLNIIPKGSERFQLLSMEMGLLDNQVWSAFEDSRGNFWIGTETGLNVHSLNISAELEAIVNHFKNQRVMAITEDRLGRLWVGTSKRGLSRVNRDGSIVRLPLPGPTRFYQAVSCFAEDERYMWVGTFGRLLQFALDDDALLQVDERLNPRIDSMRYVLSLHSRDSELFVGTYYPMHILHKERFDYDAFEFKPGGDHHHHHPSFQFGSGISVSNDREVWFSTFGGGLNKLNRKTRTFEYYSINEGLANPVLTGLVPSGDDFWVSHNAGISRFDTATKTFANYALADGVPFSEFSLGAYGKMSDGRIFFGGTQGLVIINPNDFEEEPFTKVPALSEYSINYQSRAINELNGRLKLYPEDRTLSLRFTCIDFMHAKNLRYQYTLSGFDSVWVDSPVSERRATYSSLPAGDYVFKVRVADQNGRWSENELQLQIIVIPPIWQRLWFILILATSVILTIVVVVRFLSQLQIKRKLREMEMQQRVHRERERISMDLHDHVGAQITYLISNLDRLGIEQQNDEGSIRGLGKYARDAMRELRDTVWAIRKDSMTLGEIKQRINQFGNSLFQETGTHFKTEVYMSDDLVLEPAPALHLLRILQEALHNIHKHAEAKKAVISITMSGSELKVEIRDDGTGFSETSVDGEEHNGLRNMRDRASEIGALFSVKSKAGEGTTIRLSIPVSNKASAS